LIPRRTFIVRFYEEDRTVVLEDSLTRERVRLGDVTHVGEQLQRWLAERPRGSRPPSESSASESP
jgi:hypothetical protein